MTELCGFGTRAGGTVSIVLLCGSPSVQPKGGHHLPRIEPFPHVANTEASLAWQDLLIPPCDSLRSCPIQLKNCSWKTSCLSISFTLDSPQGVHLTTINGLWLALLVYIKRNLQGRATQASPSCSISWTYLRMCRCEIGSLLQCDLRLCKRLQIQHSHQIWICLGLVRSAYSTCWLMRPYPIQLGNCSWKTHC